MNTHMQNIYKIMARAASALIAATLVVGCNLDKVEPSMDADGVIVQLSVSADDMLTKAVEESAIQTIRIFAFDQDGNPAGHIYKENPEAGENFHMVIMAFGTSGTISVDFYAVANEKSMYHEGSSISLRPDMTAQELNDLVYSSLVTSYGVMPLYGKLDDKALVLTNVYHIEDDHAAIIAEPVAINLSRSLAKIGVYAAALEGTTADPVIESITLVSAGRRDVSYLFPAQDAASLKERDSKIASLTSDRIFSLDAAGQDFLSNVGEVSKRLSEQITSTDITVTDHYTEILSPFYLAEVPYGSDAWDEPADPAGRPVALVIKYSFGDRTVTKYATVNMPAIERNAFYQVRCLVKTDGQLLVNISVNPWVEGEAWDISFDFPTHTDPLLATSTYNSLNGEYPAHIYGSEATMFHTGSDAAPEEGGAFSVDFNMSYPIGGVWKPTLSGASNDDYEVRLYERGSTEKIDNMSVVIKNDNKDTWYTIKVVPKKSTLVGKKVTLSISYTNLYLGAEYAYLLQVNGGEEDKLAWVEKDPVSGDEFEASTVDIVITQVDTPTSGI